jgi:hypothetical protein
VPGFAPLRAGEIAESSITNCLLVMLCCRLGGFEVQGHRVRVASPVWDVDKRSHTMDTLPAWLELWWLRESPRHSSKVSSRCSCSRQTIRCTTAGAWETRCHDERCRKASASFQLPSNGAREKAKNEDGRDGSRDGYRLLGCRHAHAHAHARPSKQRALLDTSARHDRWERRLYTMRPRYGAKIAIDSVASLPPRWSWHGQLR